MPKSRDIISGIGIGTAAADSIQYRSPVAGHSIGLTLIVGWGSPGWVHIGAGWQIWYVNLFSGVAVAGNCHCCSSSLLVMWQCSAGCSWSTEWTGLVWCPRWTFICYSRDARWSSTVPGEFNSINRQTATTQPPLWPWYRLICRTGGFCWCKVLLPACPCWEQAVHSD